MLSLKSPKISHRPKTFAHKNKSQKLHFYVTISVDNFFRMSFFATQRILNQQSKSAFFNSAVIFIYIFFLICTHFSIQGTFLYVTPS
jgi:hypothetical protein